MPRLQRSPATEPLSRPFAPRSGSRLVAVLLACLVAGTLDIAFAVGFWAWKADVPAGRIFRSVASGLLGPAAFEGGAGVAALGLVLHYGIALTLAWVYWRAARSWALLRHRPILCGAVYGLAAYAVMNYVVVPLSAASPGSHDPLWLTLGVLVHVFWIGVPIAWITTRGWRRGAGRV